MKYCVILDDEPLAIDLLQSYVEKTEDLTVAYAGTDVFECIHFIQKNKIDIIFLDIQMPELTGLQVLKIIGNEYHIIFTTAYSDYALEGYEHDISDYLLKPISYERFLKAIAKTGNIVHEKAIPAETPNDFIFIKTDNKMVRVLYSEILYIEGLKDYISIHTTGEKLITLMTLKSLEQSLPARIFMRVHKSYIIALAQVKAIERNRIFIGEDIIPIGETYKEAFLERIT